MATDLQTKLVIEAQAKGNEEINRLQESLRQLEDAVSGGGEQFSAIADELQRLAQQSAAIEAFTKTKTAVEQTAARLGELQKSTAEAAAAFAQAKEYFGAGSEQARKAGEHFETLRERTRSVKDELGKQREQLERSRDALREAGVNSKELGGAQLALRSGIEGTRNALSGLSTEAQKTAQVMSDRNMLGVPAHKDVQKEIDATKAAFERLQASGQLSGKELAQAAMKADERIRELKASTNGWMESLGKAKVALAGLAGGVAGLKVAADKAIAFESAMSDVKKVVDGTEEQMDGLAQSIKAMSREIPIAADGLAAIAAAGGQMGVPIENIETFVELAAKMGTAFGMSAEQAGDAVAKLSNVFSLPIEQVESLGDAINVLGNTMAAKESDIVEVLKRIGGSAKQFGLSAEQAAALGASMLALGVRAEVAGTGINAILTKLQTASMQGKEFQAALEGMGMSAEQLARDIEANPQKALEEFLRTLSKLEGSDRAETLTKLFGIEYQDDVARLIGSLETYEGALGRIGDAAQTAGAMQKEFEEKNKTTAAQLKKLKNIVDEIIVNFGEAFLPLLKQMVQWTGDMVQPLSALTAEFPKLTAAVTGFVAVSAALGPVRTVVLALGTAFSGLGAIIPKLAVAFAGLTTSLQGVMVAARAATASLVAAAAPVAALAAPFVAVAVAAGLCIAKFLEIGKTLKETREVNKRAAESAERLAESEEKLAAKLAEISKTTGVTVRSMEELDRAVADGRLVFDQATATWLSAAQAQEKMAQSASTAADGVKTLGEKARQGAGDIMAAFQQAAEGGKKLEEALKELPKALDMKAGAEGVAAFALALDGLAQKNKYLEESAKLSAAQVSEAWKHAIDGMNAGNIGVLIENLKEAERQGALTAEQLAAAFDGIAGAALDRLGANAAQALGMVSKEARKAIDDLDAVINTISLAGIEGEKAGRAIEQAFAAAIPKADSLAAIKELEQRLLAAKDAGLVSERAFRSMKDALDGMKQALDPVNRLEAALKKLGVEMTKTWGGISSGARDAIKNVKDVRDIIAETGETGKKAGETIKAAFLGAIKKMDSLDAIKAMREEIRAAGEAGQLTAGQMNELTAALNQQEAALRQNTQATGELAGAMDEASGKADEYVNAMVYLGSIGGDTAAAAREAADALNTLASAGGDGLQRTADAARDAADAEKEAGDAAEEAGEKHAEARRVIEGTWMDARIAASAYAQEAASYALEAAKWITGISSTLRVGAGNIASYNNLLNELAEQYVRTMESYDRQMQQLFSQQSGAAAGVEDLKLRLLELNGTEEQIAEARAAREKLQLEMEIKSLEIEKSRAAFQGDNSTVAQINEEIKLMKEQQALLAQIHKEEARQRKEAAKEKERQEKEAEKEARRKQREEKKKTAEEAAGDSAKGTGSSGSTGAPSTSGPLKTSTINLGGVTINGAGISDPAKLAKLLEPELKKLQRLAA